VSTKTEEYTKNLEEAETIRINETTERKATP
jgi:hypothetical protein